MIIMSDKKIFIEQIERLIAEGLVLDDEAQKFFDNLKKEDLKSPLTEKGKTILSFMQKNVVLFNNVFKAKDIADGLGINGKSVSGSMKKLLKHLNPWKYMLMTSLNLKKQNTE